MSRRPVHSAREERRTTDMTRISWAAATAALLVAGTALAATPAQNCQSGKNKQAGSYLECRQKAEANFVLKGDTSARALALQKCADKYGLRWPQVEDRAGGTC